MPLAPLIRVGLEADTPARGRGGRGVDLQVDASSRRTADGIGISALVHESPSQGLARILASLSPSLSLSLSYSQGYSTMIYIALHASALHTSEASPQTDES
jgi:hypothetical protein